MQFCKLKIIDTHIGSAKKNMAIDQQLLLDLHPDDLPLLHLYEWERPSITYGHFVQPSELLNLKEIKKRKIDIARRLTGGGVTLHFCDYAFSFLMPANHPCFYKNTLQNYRFVNQFVVRAVENLLPNSSHLTYLESEDSPRDLELNFCMAKPTKYDVMYLGQKIGGAAQRRKSQGYLHHGTISIALPDLKLIEAIILSKRAAAAMAEQTFSFTSKPVDNKALTDYREKIQTALIRAIDEYTLQDTL